MGASTESLSGRRARGAAHRIRSTSSRSSRRPFKPVSRTEPRRVNGGSVAVLALITLLYVSLPALGQSSLPPTASFDSNRISVTLEPFVTGLTSPDYLTGDGSGSGTLYVLEQPGRIRVVAPAGRLQPAPYLDISDRITIDRTSSQSEQGLLGLAFHPDFATNGRLFVDYTRSGDGATVISEFRAANGAVDPASERILLVIAQPFANHNGGMLAFDTQGMLLIGMGDGGSEGDPQGNGQNRQALLGKILRFDVDGAQPYRVPVDNPFVNEAGTRPEIFTLGMRNPWRFSVDRLTGDIFIGDVGQDTWEEVDVVPVGTGGQDFGWNITEGPVCYAAATCDRTGLTAPVASYSHADGDCAIIGGYVYRGTRYPALQGSYLFGDLCGKALRVFSAAEAVTTGSATPVAAGSMDGTLVSFGQGDDGELYAVDQAGRILHVLAAPAG